MTINEIIKEYGIEKLNTLTKYPSILTYHVLGEKGSLRESLVEDKTFGNEKVYVTEKIDGTNCRIVFLNGDYVIGSRENLLFAKGDRFGDPALNIVNTIKMFADRICRLYQFNDGKLHVFYGETYGGNVTSASKQYTSDKTYAFRLFDCTVMLDETIHDIMSADISQISSWREHNWDRFCNVDDVKFASNAIDVETVPYIETIEGSAMPTTLKGMYDWLQQFSKTRAGINNNGMAEGVVVRNYDRSLIRKIRFEDYIRTKNRGLF